MLHLTKLLSLGIQNLGIANPILLLICLALLSITTNFYHFFVFRRVFRQILSNLVSLIWLGSLAIFQLIFVKFWVI